MKDIINNEILSLFSTYWLTSLLVDLLQKINTMKNIRIWES